MMGRPMHTSYDGLKDSYDLKHDDITDAKRMDDDSKESPPEPALDDSDILAAAKEELELATMLRGTAICEGSVDSKLGTALTKFIQIYAPNHFDSILQSSPKLLKPS